MREMTGVKTKDEQKESVDRTIEKAGLDNDMKTSKKEENYKKGVKEAREKSHEGDEDMEEAEEDMQKLAEADAGESHEGDGVNKGQLGDDMRKSTEVSMASALEGKVEPKADLEDLVDGARGGGVVFKEINIGGK